MKLVQLKLSNFRCFKYDITPFRTRKADVFDNRLIFGDNLLALKALEREFAIL